MFYLTYQTPVFSISNTLYLGEKNKNLNPLAGFNQNNAADWRIELKGHITFSFLVKLPSYNFFCFEQASHLKKISA